VSAAFADVRGWAAYSTITNAPRERGGSDARDLAHDQLP